MMSKPHKSVFVVLIIFGILSTAASFNQPGLAQEDQTIEEKVAKLQETVEELKDRIPKIGYINRQDAFSVFPEVVEAERKKVVEVEKQMEELNTQAEQGKITESEYNRQRDLLRAKHLQARIKVDLAILETMVESKGFSDIRDRLKDLKSRTKPIRDTLDNLISDIEDYAVSPQQVSETLNKVENKQLKQLYDILTNFAQSKITQIVRQMAREKDYDLVIERQNVITYRKEIGSVVDLTEEVKVRLREQLRPE